MTDFLRLRTRLVILHFAMQCEKYSEQEKWLLIDNRFPHADDEAMGKSYMYLYLRDPKSSRKPVQNGEYERSNGSPGGASG